MHNHVCSSLWENNYTYQGFDVFSTILKWGGGRFILPPSPYFCLSRCKHKTRKTNPQAKHDPRYSCKKV